MSKTRYRGERYLTLTELYDRYRSLAAEHPAWIKLESVAKTKAGHELLLITITQQNDDHGCPIRESERLTRPALWIDAGTHAAEWAGVSAALFDLEHWIDRLNGSEGERVMAEEQRWFSEHAIYMMPLICPDGYEALWGQRPYLRSTLRDARSDLIEAGMTPHDLDGDGVTRWMRWRHPAGPFVEDEACPGLMRGRKLEDDPQSAFFMCMEGSFQLWDGVRWEEAPRPWVEGLDLNRNFPAHWQNFSMFGMDGGAYPLSETESRAVVDSFAARPRIAAALTYHTFTGALLTQPYRKNTPLHKADIRLMGAIGQQAVEGTDYRVIKIHPDFVYDEDAEVVGVWSDTLSTVFGVPGYTLELWDPFKRNGLDNPYPARFFSDPDPLLLRGLAQGFRETPGAWSEWTPFEHPQLGRVELGGLDFMMTVRNPPESELAEELERSHKVAQQMRRTLPKVSSQIKVEKISDSPRSVYKLTLILENTGFLSTSALIQGESWSGCPRVSAELNTSPHHRLLSGARAQARDHLSGWGEASLGLGGLSPSLSAKGHRAHFEWIVETDRDDDLKVSWSGGRGGAGSDTFRLNVAQS